MNTTYLMQRNDKWQCCKIFYRAISKADDNILHTQYSVSPSGGHLRKNVKTVDYGVEKIGIVGKKMANISPT